MMALIVVDVQNDFLPGGALAVPQGDAVIPELMRIIGNYDLVAVTQDWHPPGHRSFASSHPGRKPLDEIQIHGRKQVLWPDHCVWGTRGADFAPGLELHQANAFFRKGTNPDVDSYSGFFDNDRQCSTGLDSWLHGLGVKEVHVGGLAAEFCVTFTASDAAECGFHTVLLEFATRPLNPDDYQRCKPRLHALGVRFQSSPSL